MSPFIKAFTSYDLKLFLWIARRRRVHRIARIFRWVSRLGDGPFYLLLGLCLALFEPINGKRFLAAGALAMALELPLYLLLKNTVRRARPHDALGHLTAFITPSDTFSFPSGHSAAAVVAATLVGHFYTPFLFPALLVAFLICLSRVILRVHYPTDILAGIFLGLSAALTALFFVSEQTTP